MSLTAHGLCYTMLRTPCGALLHAWLRIAMLRVRSVPEDILLQHEVVGNIADGFGASVMT